MHPHIDARTSIDQAISWAVTVLQPSDTAALDARVLLEHVTGLSRSRVFAHAEDELEPGPADIYRRLIRRRATGEPVAYLRGWVEWYGEQYHVDPGVLVPRPETEVVFDCAAELFLQSHGRRAADIGTGSGILAIQLARSFPAARVDAVDISDFGLETARRNVERWDLGRRVSLRRGNLLEPLKERPDMIMANLPYLSCELMRSLPRDVVFEPRVALWGGDDGLEVYREMLDQLRTRNWIVPVVAEIDSGQAHEAVRLFSEALPSLQVDTRPDYSGRARVVVAYPGGT